MQFYLIGDRFFNHYEHKRTKFEQNQTKHGTLNCPRHQPSMRISPTLTFFPSSVIPSHIKAALSEVIIEPNKFTLSYITPFHTFPRVNLILFRFKLKSPEFPFNRKLEANFVSVFV